MAKLGGEQTELLQISGDERARATRTALLFTEEELTRNLQIVLRTFDDLNYRQEQRFHLELGLMKLVHAQRLLPIEELLSGMSSGTPVRSTGSSAPRTASTPARNLPSATPASAPPAPRSPFGFSSGSRPAMQPSAPATESRTVVAPPPEPTPAIEIQGAASASAIPQISRLPVGFAEPFADDDSEESAPVESAPLNGAAARAEGPTVDSVKQAIVSSLAQAGHASASTLLSTARFTLEPTSLRIEVPGIGKKMLGLTVNAACEKLIKQELQRLGGPARFMVIPGEGIASVSSVSAPVEGSVQQAALEHPMVQRAKEIFNAEVRSVVDLRNK